MFFKRMELIQELESGLRENALAADNLEGGRGLHVPLRNKTSPQELEIHLRRKRLVELVSRRLEQSTLLMTPSLFRGLVGDIVGRADGENALVAADEERPFEEPCALVMKEIFVPAIFDQLGNDDDDAPVGMFLGEF